MKHRVLVSLLVVCLVSCGDDDPVAPDPEASASVAALHFNGIDQSAETPDSPLLDLSKTWTLEAWIFPNPSEAARQDIVAKWGGPAAAYILLLQSGQITLGTHDGTNTTLNIGSNSIEAGEWSHVAAVFENGRATIYLNGFADAVRSDMVVPQNGTAPVMLGSQDRFGSWYSGVIDEVRVWNVARTQQQIFSSKDVQVPSGAAGLVAYWRLDEGSGDSASDATGNGHTIQLGNSWVGKGGRPVWVTPGKP